MNMKNRMLVWVAGIITIVLVLMAVIVSLEPPKAGVPRSEAFKALALSITSKEDCQQRESAREHSSFSAKEKDNWFVKYMDFLYEEGYLSQELTPASLSTAQGNLTYEEASYAADKVSARLKQQVGMTKKNKKKAYPKERWWELYAAILEETDKEGAVREVDAILFGTPSNLEDAKSWTAYTTEGDFGFQGLALDAYIDCEIRFLVRDGEIAGLKEVVSQKAVYENLWLAQSDGGYFDAYMGTVRRQFPAGKAEGLTPNLADLHLENGVLKKVTVKKGRINGKVLSVTKDAIELEGYGSIPLSANFHVYKIYGDFKVLGASDILVGYNLQEFVAADGKLCAALLEQEFEPDTIRVLLMDNGFGSIFHPGVKLTVNSEAQLSYEDSRGKTESVTLKAGETLEVTPEDERLKYGRMTLKPSAAEGITIHSIERSQGQPVYSGSLDIKAEEQGLTLVNELYLEDYLTKVVPSEMPPTYEEEALKAQAVCARTYSYRQIESNDYGQYGAHVDDSTNYQVYNNTKTNERTTQAVKDTYGKMLFYGDKPAETVYYATSCGWGTDGSVWGNDGSALPYLRAMEIKKGGKELTQEGADFDSYIRGEDSSAYEASFPMFRWQVNIPAQVLSSQINGAGDVSDVSIESRGPGGIASEIKVKGSEDTIYIKGQSAIRTALGSKELSIKKQDGTRLEGNATLPSAFISIEKRTDADGKPVFHIWGGGFGHGAGMSQNGAQGMAKAGKSYEDILDFFYHGTQVREK